MEEKTETKTEFWGMMTVLAGLVGAGVWSIAASNDWLVPWIAGSATAIGVAYIVARTFLKMEREKTINFISDETEALIEKILAPVQALKEALDKKDEAAK